MTQKWERWRVDILILRLEFSHASVRKFEITFISFVELYFEAYHVTIGDVCGWHGVSKLQISGVRVGQNVLTYRTDLVKSFSKGLKPS
jgi:hypothetical protein